MKTALKRSGKSSSASPYEGLSADALLAILAEKTLSSRLTRMRFNSVIASLKNVIMSSRSATSPSANGTNASRQTLKATSDCCRHASRASARQVLRPSLPDGLSHHGQIWRWRAAEPPGRILKREGLGVNGSVMANWIIRLGYVPRPLINLIATAERLSLSADR